MDNVTSLTSYKKTCSIGTLSCSLMTDIKYIHKGIQRTATRKRIVQEKLLTSSKVMDDLLLKYLLNI